jgi:hypothetical protein
MIQHYVMCLINYGKYVFMYGRLDSPNKRSWVEPQQYVEAT